MKALKNKIIESFESQTPDLKEKVVLLCQNQTQEQPVEKKTLVKTPKKLVLRKMVAVFSCLILFGLGLFVGNFFTLPQTANAQRKIYLDVNPSIELSIDKNDIVVSCTAINDDAKKILNDMNLEKVELKTALNAIVGSMYVNGYLTSENNSILISVDNTTDDFLTFVTTQVNNVFKNSNMECSIIAQEININDDLKQKAEEQGVSVGKMHLLNKIVDGVEEISDDDIPNLSKMSIKDLNLIYSKRPNDKPDDDKRKDEVFSGEVNVAINEENAIQIVLNYMSKTEEDFSYIHARVLPSKHHRENVVYHITLTLKNSNQTYKYEVDCNTGEFFEIEDDFDGENDFPHKPNDKH